VNNGSDRIFRTFPIEKSSIKTETKLVKNNDSLKQKINLQIEKDKIFTKIEIKKEKCENKNASMFAEEYILGETKIDKLKEKINLQIEKDKIFTKIEIKKEKCENNNASMFEKGKFLGERNINNFEEKLNLPNKEKNVSTNEKTIKKINKEKNDVVLEEENLYDDSNYEAENENEKQSMIEEKNCLGKRKLCQVRIKKYLLFQLKSVLFFTKNVFLTFGRGRVMCL
jgi:hypothetical protein